MSERHNAWQQFTDKELLKFEEFFRTLDAPGKSLHNADILKELRKEIKRRAEGKPGVSKPDPYYLGS